MKVHPPPTHPTEMWCGGPKMSRTVLPTAILICQDYGLSDLYCLKSSLVNPLSWMIFICFTMVLFPDSPAPAQNIHFKNEQKHFETSVLSQKHIFEYITYSEATFLMEQLRKSLPVA